MNSYPLIHTELKKRQNRLDSRETDGQSRFLLYAAQLSGLRDFIDAVREIMLQDQIWPDQYDSIVYQIKPFKKTADSISQFVAKSKTGRTSGFSNYSLIVNSSHLSQQMEILISLFREYKELADQMRGKRTNRMQINHYLDSLETSLSDTLKELGKAARGI